MAVSATSTHCPRCTGLNGLPRDEPAPALIVSGGRLSLDGYCIDVSDRGLRPWLRIDTPTAVIHDGPEPGRHWTEKGATLALAGPPVLAALLLAIGLRWVGLPPLFPVAAFLSVALAGWLVVAARWRFEPSRLDRAVDAGWSMLAPHLHQPEYAPEDGTFLAALACVSGGKGRPELRGPALQRAILLAEQAADPPSRQLAALARLAITDGVQAGGDPALLTCQQIAPVFQGALPLPFAHHLLERWRTPFWTPVQRARLRVLLAAAAFEAGLDFHDLCEMAILAPALGEVLEYQDAAGLARLRLLWTLRAARSWERCGEAFTVFELAGHARLVGRQFELVPDLLLWQAGPETDLDDPPASIGLCGRGVVFAGLVLTHLPTIEVRPQARRGVAGYELTAGGQAFWYPRDPAEAARRLQAWCDYCFCEFQPQALALLTRRSPRPARLCPACQRLVRPGA